MCNWRYSSYSFKLILVTNFIFLIMGTINGTEDCNSNDTVIAFILKQIGKANFTKEFDKVNWKWPSCSTIVTHEIDKNKLSTEVLKYSFHWINRYILSMNFNGSDKILVNMERGDDWIIGKCMSTNNANFNGYFQLIDSRTLDILYTTNINIRDYANLPNEIINKIGEVIDLSSFDTGKKVKITISHFGNDEIEGDIGCQTDDSYCRIPKGKDKVLFWTNGRIMIVSIPKIRTPYRDKFGYYSEWTIGGIPRNDKRSFKRFSNGNEIDCEKEMILQFPWVDDSLSKWRTK